MPLVTSGGAAALAESPPGVAEYFDAFHAAFGAAGERAGIVERDIEIGPMGVALRFAGYELLPTMLPALAHRLAARVAEPQGTICVWDSASTGVEVPSFSWRPRDVRQRGEIVGFNDGRFRTIYHGDLLAADGGFDALSMYDADRNTAVFWVSSRERIHWYEPAEPLRPSLHWVLGGPGRHLAHAAAVGDEHGAVLLAGKGGSGKTTTTLACLAAGMRFVGDNYVLLTLEDTPRASSIYCNAKLTRETLALLPGLAPAVKTLDVEEGEKLIVDVFRHRPDQIASSLPVRALVVPTVIGRGETRLVPASPVEGLLALAPTTVYQLPGNGAVLRAMAELVRAMPTYRLDLGSEVADGPRVIRRLLSEGTP